MWALIALGFAAGMVGAAARWKTETRNRSVEITLDFNELRAMAAAQGVSIRELLRTFKAAGATSVAVQEETVGGLDEARRVDVTTSPDGQSTVLIGPESARVFAALAAKTKFGPSRPGDAIPQPYAIVRSVGVGLDPATVEVVHDAGLDVVGRVGNWEGVTSAGIRWTLTQLKRQGVRTVIFSGDETLGFKGLIASDPKNPSKAATEGLMRDLDLNYGVVEFVKQKGDDTLTRALADRVVRVHTVSGAEMLTANIPTNIQRFELAARERNIRLLFVRLFTEEPDPIAENVKYVEKIAKGMEAGNLVVGPAHGYADLTTSRVLHGLIGLGLAAAWLLLLDRVTGFLSLTTGAGRLVLFAGVGGALLLAGLSLGSGTTGIKLDALAAACLFPTLALVHTDLLRPGGGIGEIFRRLAVTSLITLLGVGAIVGLLADRLFLIKADAFAGIKAAQLVPVVIVALVYGLGLWASADRPWPRVVDETKRRLLGVSNRPVLIWQVAVALVVLVAAALLVLRSGNDPGVGVSPIELKVRAILDRFLFTRPRFKEFLIGHPAMFVALGLALKKRRNWAYPFFIGGAIGQVSLLNTFCHLHTPLPISLGRALLGLLFGCIIGLVAYVVVDRILKPRAA